MGRVAKAIAERERESYIGMESLEIQDAEISSCIDQAARADDPAEKLAEAEAMLKLMKAEIRTLSAPDKDKWQSRSKALEGRLKRAQLLGNKPSTVNDHSDASNAPPDEIAASAQRQKNMLLEAKRQLEETEQVGAQTMQDLARQREVILKTQQNVSSINQDLDQSNRIMSRMSKWWRG